jgi:uncharacterized membrane protein YkoI
MKIKILICGLLTAVLVCASLTPAVAGDSKEKQAKLEAKAKVSRADAEKIALAQVPNGTIKEGEIEKEKGKLIWSFDIATPDTKDITEVNVDAMTGKIVAIDKESAKDEENEKKGEKHEKEKDDDDKK